MGDLQQFEAQDFDPVAWINQASTLAPVNEPMERYLAELEMKLHLTAEDVEAALEEQSTRALQRIPAAVHEMLHVKGDAVSLKTDAHKMLRQLDSAQQAAAHSVARLVEIDTVKSRMEAACKTLKEATELSDLFQRIEHTFASGDLPRIADMLATMRRSLSLVGDVPEFKGGMQRLQTLEDRFQALVEPALASALSQRRGDQVQQLSGMLLGIQRYGSLEKLYISARLAPLQALWDGFERSATAAASPSGNFATWLGTFYDEVLSATEAEAHWCASVLPDQHPQLVLRLLSSLFQKIDKAFRSRLASACGKVGGGSAVLGLLLGMQESAVEFATSLHKSLSGVPLPDLQPVFAAVYSPYESQIRRYGELEGQRMHSDMASIRVPADADDDLETLIAAMSASVPQAVLIVESAKVRCMKLTGGTELQALMIVADDNLTDYINGLQAAVRTVRGQCLGDAQPGATSESMREPAAVRSEDTAAVLPLLTVAGTLASRLDQLNGALRGAALSLVPVLEALRSSSDAAGSLDMLSLRLHSAEVQLRTQLRDLANSAQQEGFSALPSTAACAAAFQQSVHSLIYDLLITKVKTEMSGVGSMPVWGAAEPENALNLPSFNAYPLPYVTTAGEYLMMLPQMLESLLTAGDESDEEDHIDDEWLDKVAAGAAELYAEQLRQVPHLSLHGVQQLAADLEYFCNVMSALGVALPPALATWQAAVNWPAADFPGAANAALEEGSVDPTVLKHIAKARNVLL
ncbi:hypothetical protein WJX72_006519 [[Myrmecia] bisecta]|uniref:Conserved oligomeric Golgi complex subunit 7 n=1 Tax=[Myrmecia] bisecta TaxID=41462 RepID=A0AAW1R7P6_9CHLO